MNYQLDISPAAQPEIKRLPGHIRQQVRRAIQSLSDDPRPARSKKLDFTLPGTEPRRLRLDHWRIVYAVIETDFYRVAIVAVRKRPPYEYSDLPDLFENL